ncbi:MAG: AsnC family transcriptional regulator [Methanocellales archaeon]|nr:AsnC family transcriptional regulator [Methanocellales archaeon]MDI6902613.1 AsnC family transcriptional regulator [Methanocellales archaeon]
MLYISTEELAMRLDSIDKNLLNVLQDELPLVSRPFEELGKGLGISEEDVISRVKRLLEEGVIRRIGPIIDIKKLGGVSTLVAMSVPSERVDETAAMINEYPEVTHNYLRSHRYNVWFTISASSKERLEEILGEIKKLGYELIDLPATKMFKIRVKFDMK